MLGSVSLVLPEIGNTFALAAVLPARCRHVSALLAEVLFKLFSLSTSLKMFSVSSVYSDSVLSVLILDRSSSQALSYWALTFTILALGTGLCQ